MSQAIELLDEALELARREKAALENGGYDEAIELAKKRGEITGMAWNKLESADHGEYQKRLQMLSKMLTGLTDFASRAHETARARLSSSKREKKRIRGYQMAVGQALQ